MKSPITLATLLSLLIASGLSAADKRPNFLIIFTDDQGYGDVSAYGKSDVRTPNIDRIGSEGLLFTNMRANCTVCSPSRAALLTGRNADRVGVPGVIRTQPEGSWGYFDPTVPTLADQLGELGYHTALVGKWHLGLESPNTPNERGFDFFHGFLGDMMNDYYKCTRHGINYLRRNEEIVQPTKHATDMFTDWAVDYLESRSQSTDDPFFLFLSYNAPHFPIQPPKEWFEMVRERDPSLDKDRARNVAFVEHLDAAIGRVLQALDAKGLAENTVVVFASDNGGALRFAQSNAPWRGGKQDHYDGGLKVPFMMRWPAAIQSGRISDYEGLNFDVFPTFIELAGGTPSEELDALSLLPLIKGEALDTPRDLYFVRREGGKYYGKAYHAVISEGWKLMQNDTTSPFELYHLAEDPLETTNLIDAEPEQAKRLQKILQSYIQTGGQTPWQKPSESTH